ncbi:MAG TPA: HNH endonuclease [Bacteroidales bacterium]|nr:HNH endonuclease [Bacteroidales bacterium]
MNSFEEYRFFSKPLLEEANNAAHREKRNKCIDHSIIASLSIDNVYHVVKFMYHRKNELRLFIEIDKTGRVELLDTSITRYESLPIIRYFEDGSYDVKFSDRPYPNRREWQESEVLKPIRKQSTFRKKVLEAYDYCCSICELNEVGLLRAAHILDVKNGGPDTIDNGISLCVNHEIAFDKGLIVIHPDYSVECINNLGVTVKRLKLPKIKENYPSSEYLRRKIELLNNIN